MEAFSLPKSMLERLREAGRSQDITPFSFLLANFYLMLYQRTGQKEITVAVPSANRTRSAYKDGIGLFARNLPIRMQVVDHLPFGDYAREVHKTLREGMVHQDIAMHEVLKHMKIRDGRVFYALYQVCFIYQNAMLMQIEQSGTVFKLELMWDLSGMARSNMVWQLYETPEGLEGYVEYAARLFEQDTVVWFVENYQHLLEETIQDPQRVISEVVKNV